MRGLGVFSPNPAYSRCVLVVPVFDDSCGLASPRSKSSADVSDPKSLSLLEFDIRRGTEHHTNSLATRFDSFSNYNTFGYQNPFTGQSSDFGAYEDVPAVAGIADFRLVHACKLELPDNGNASAVKWAQCRDADGLVLVGTSTGDVNCLSGRDLLSFGNGNGANKAVVESSIHVCNNPVKRLSYNSKTSTLAVAGYDGQISSVDLGAGGDAKVVDISFGKWRVGMVTGLSWNNRLGHILATSGSCSMQSGTVSPSDSSGLVVWDLKVRKPASSFRDPNGRLNPIGIEWLPDQLTQLVVGYGDDKSPALQLWDLRNCSVPLKEIKAHTRGLTSLSFSPHDQTLLLTSGRDDFTRCWSMDQTRGPFNLVSSIQTEALSHHKRVEWHPTFPGLFLGQDTDDENLLYQVYDSCASIDPAVAPAAVPGAPAPPAGSSAGVLQDSHLPSWVRPLFGVASGFGGNVYTWNIGGDVKGYNLKADLDLNVLEKLDNAIVVLKQLENSNNFSSVCRQNIAVASVDDVGVEALTWKILDAQRRGDALAIAEALGYKLHSSSGGSNDGVQSGFSDSRGFGDLSGFRGAASDSFKGSGGASDPIATGIATGVATTTGESTKTDEEFFNALVAQSSNKDAGADVGLQFDASSVANKSGSVEVLAGALDESAGASKGSAEAEDFQNAADGSAAVKSGGSWGEDPQQRASVIRNDFASAAELSLKRGNAAEALMLAYAGGPDLWLQIAGKVTFASHDPFLKTIYYLMQGDLSSLVKDSDLEHWRETLACTCNVYQVSNKPELLELCGQLADRLYSCFNSNVGTAGVDGARKYLEAACVTYLCAGNAPKTLETWRLLQDNCGALDARAKSLVFCAALHGVLKHSSITDAIGYNATLVAETLVEAGHLNKALDCLGCSFVKQAPAAAALIEKIQAATSTSASGLTSGSSSGGVLGASAGAGKAGASVASSGYAAAATATTSTSTAGASYPSVATTSNVGMKQQSANVHKTAGSATTAPGAVAGAMYPGMPVPWPLPTETQQKASHIKSTQESNRKIIATATASTLVPGEHMSLEDLTFCTQVLSGLVPVGEDTRAAQETRRRVDELVDAINKGQLPREANELLTQMCTALSQGDKTSANIILSQISTKLWNSQNKGWIMCLKRIVPK